MTSASAKEKRKHRRLEVAVSVRLKHKSRLQDFFSRNLSEGGLFLEVEELLPLHSQVTLALDIPGRKEPLEVEAEVVRHHRFKALDEELREKNQKGVGLQFVRLDDEQRRLIQQYVAGQDVALRQ